MTRLAYADYLRHIEVESARFRDALAKADPKLIVPSCPDWSAADLLWHLTEVQWFWGSIAIKRPESADHGFPEPVRPESYDDLLNAFDEQSSRLVSALRDADPAAPAWTWSSEQTVGFLFRRQAHEALIHRLDAELTTDQVTPLDPTLASDGVEETLDVMFGGNPPWGMFTALQHYVRVDVTDTGDTVWVQLGRFTGTDEAGVQHDEEDIRVVADPGLDPDAVVEGPASALDAWLWRRGDDSEIKVHGDRAAYDRFRLAVNHPIN